VKVPTINTQNFMSRKQNINMYFWQPSAPGTSFVSSQMAEILTCLKQLLKALGVGKVRYDTFLICEMWPV
jgi:hypothetical protein